MAASLRPPILWVCACVLASAAHCSGRAAVDFADAGCAVTGTEADCAGLGLEMVPLNLPASLTSLDLSGNYIAKIGAADFAGLTALSVLNLANNRITTIDGTALQDTVLLTALDVSGNRIETLPKDLLTHNRGARFPLEYLDLSSNDIDTVERAALFYLSSLTTLDVSNNKLEEDNFWGGSFLHLLNMTTLKMNSNDFTSLDAYGTVLLKNNAALTTLEIKDNAITSIPAGMFVAQIQLQTLKISNNKLTKLPADLFREQKALETLDLGGNEIGAIPAATFASLSSLSNLEMGGNPSTCDIASCAEQSASCNSKFVCDCEDDKLDSGASGFCDVSTTTTTATTTTTTITITTTTITTIATTAKPAATTLALTTAERRVVPDTTSTPEAFDLGSDDDTTPPLNRALADVAKAIAGTANAPLHTVLNSIPGVSGALESVNYNQGFRDGTYADSSAPTPAEVQTVIDAVNTQVTTTGSAANRVTGTVTRWSVQYRSTTAPATTTRAAAAATTATVVTTTTATAAAAATHGAVNREPNTAGGATTIGAAEARHGKGKKGKDAKKGKKAPSPRHGNKGGKQQEREVSLGVKSVVGKVYKGKRIAKEGKAPEGKAAKSNSAAMFENFGQTAIPTTYEDTVLLAVLASAVLVAVFVLGAHAKKKTAGCTGGLQARSATKARPETALLFEYSQPKRVTEAAYSEYSSPIDTAPHTVLDVYAEPQVQTV